MEGVTGRVRSIRLPLALVVARYFLYVLIAALLAVGIPAGVFAVKMRSGAILAADYGEAHLDEVEGILAGQASFDASVIPSAYRYVRFAADGTPLASDMTALQLEAAQDAAVLSGSEGSRATRVGVSSFYAAVDLADGGRCVLCYDIMPQWADKEMRDALPNPQGLLVWAVLSLLILSVALTALRAAHVLTRKMDPLVRAAEAVGRQDLDTPVEGSNVAEIDDALHAMDAMRISLKDSLAMQRAVEQRSREQIAALAHDLKTPLAVVQGNAELLAEDAASGAFGAEQAACVQDIQKAATSMDAFVGRIVETSWGREEGLSFGPVDPGVIADSLVDAAGRLVGARGLVLAVSRTAAFREACAAIAEGDTPPLWDAGTVERAVLNLASNACDYAGDGPVVLTFSFDAAMQAFSIAVEDDGPGFSPEALERGAERLFRGDVSRANAGGTHFGLGLSIAAGIASAHGGGLELSNRTDGAGSIVGACAAITLPLSRPSPLEPAVPSAASRNRRSHRAGRI